MNKKLDWSYDPSQPAEVLYELDMQWYHDPERLAVIMTGWRKLMKLTAAEAAHLLGIPVRTLNGIEQGRGFRYPELLAHSIRHIDEVCERGGYHAEAS